MLYIDVIINFISDFGSVLRIIQFRIIFRMVRQVGVKPLLAASLSVTDASERVTDLSLIQALAQPTLPGPLYTTVIGSRLEWNVIVVRCLLGFMSLKSYPQLFFFSD